MTANGSIQVAETGLSTALHVSDVALQLMILVWQLVVLLPATYGLVLQSYVSQSARLPVHQCLSDSGDTRVCL